jgi:tetratricopeptide (TPR) repeat protein
MLTEDYLLRMISQALAALMTAIGLKKSGKYSEALQAIEQAVEQLTTLPANLVDQMDESSILSMLTVQERLDTGRLALLADLYQEKGEILSNLNRTAQANDSFSRALRFELEVVLADESNLTLEYIGKIESLYSRLRDQTFPVDTLLALSDYYQRLLTIDEQTLVNASLRQQKISEVLAKLNNQINSVSSV